jgi:23S rRNA (cytosine1962-C5)-methyltransferase
VAAYARDADVLDAFAYSGGFALAALGAGASGAMLIDSSAEALHLAERDAARNGFADRCAFVVANVFEELRVLKQAGRLFDLVVLDPPKFVHSADQIAAGSRGYKDINLLALQLVRPGGALATFSCSGHVDAALFQKIIAGAAIDSGRSAQILERLSQPADHPVATEFPEAEYLKGLILRVH